MRNFYSVQLIHKDKNEVFWNARNLSSEGRKKIRYLNPEGVEIKRDFKRFVAEDFGKLRYFDP